MLPKNPEWKDVCEILGTFLRWGHTPIGPWEMCGYNCANVFFKLIIWVHIVHTSCKIHLRGMTQNLTNEKSKLVQETLLCISPHQEYLINISYLGLSIVIWVAHTNYRSPSGNNGDYKFTKLVCIFINPSFRRNFDYSQVSLQRGPIYHVITYDNAITVAERESGARITTDTPYLALAGELWAVYFWGFWRKLTVL